MSNKLRSRYQNTLSSSLRLNTFIQGNPPPFCTAWLTPTFVLPASACRAGLVTVLLAVGVTLIVSTSQIGQ